MGHLDLKRPFKFVREPEHPPSLRKARIGLKREFERKLGKRLTNADFAYLLESQAKRQTDAVAQ